MRTSIGSVAAVSALVAAGALPGLGIARGADGPPGPVASSTASVDGSAEQPPWADGSADKPPSADDSGEQSPNTDDHGDRSPSTDDDRDDGGPPPWAHNGGRGAQNGHAPARGNRHRSGRGAEMSALGRAHGEAMRAWSDCVRKAAQAHSEGEPFDPTGACGEKPTPPGHVKRTGSTG